MHVTIDKVGRIVVPKKLRDELGLTPKLALEIDIVDGHLEISTPHEPATLITGPHGPSIAATGTPLTDKDVRDTLEAIREHR
jgi:AbrB family looped-hinge helix DNA binding protein